MAEISQIGEFGLIDRLTNGLSIFQKSTQLGVGDDCAIISRDENFDTLITTDLLMEGVHFDLTYMPLMHLGYKSAQVNFSDVYAMGGMPEQITVSLAIGKRFSVEDIEQIYAGIRLACEKHKVDIVGGDTTSSVTGLCISITCIGSVAKGKAIRRSTAKPTDLICVSGNLGAAYMGLQLLEREKAVYYEQWQEFQKETENKKANEQLNFQPDFSGREYILERQMRPEARRDIVEQLLKADIHPTAMMDISDGLSSELLHICKASNVGCRIYEERIPLDYQTAAMAEELNMNVTTCALNGGEDYELLFTVPLSVHEQISDMQDIHVIGHITEASLSSVLITRDGQEFQLKAQGWNPLAEEG